MATEQIDWNHWIIRLVAFIIDSIIFGVIVGIAGLVFPLGWLFGTVFWGVLLWLYFSVLDVYMSSSIGKRLLNIQVVMVNGGRVPFEKALIRNLFKIVTPLLIVDWLVGVLTPGNRHQKFLDRVAGVTFVRADQYAYPPPPPPPPA
jgi:uncharacterized RDD family membrane protein YckC